MKVIETGKNQFNNPSFGHAIRVNICVQRPGGGYDFINPSNNSKTYKKLNSKIINWLNENIISELREQVGKNRLLKQKQTLNEDFLQKKFVNDFTTLDSDYREFNIARSVYDRHRLGYIATGVDVAVLENIKGAKEIGKVRKESLWQWGTTSTPIVNKYAKKFQHDGRTYIQHPQNRLTKDGKEVMLELIFKTIGHKKGEPIYELDSYEFKQIKKQIDSNCYSGEDVLALKRDARKNGDIQRTFKHIVDRILGLNIEPDSVRIDKNAVKTKKRTKKTKAINPQTALKKSRRKKRFSDNTNQLTLNFEDTKKV